MNVQKTKLADLTSDGEIYGPYEPLVKELSPDDPLRRVSLMSFFSFFLSSSLVSILGFSFVESSS